MSDQEQPPPSGVMPPADPQPVEQPPPSGVMPPADPQPVEQPTQAGFPPPQAPASTPPAKKSTSRTILTMAVGLLAAAVGYFGVQALFFKESSPPTADEVSAAFTPVEGYSYSEFPAQALDQARQQFSSTPGLDPEDITMDGRLLNVGAQPIGAVVIIGVSPDNIGDDEREAFIGGFESSSGADMKPGQIGSADGYSGTGPSGASVVFFDEDGMIFLLQGGPSTDEETLTGIAESLQSSNA